jgi:hypothetical protein
MITKLWKGDTLMLMLSGHGCTNENESIGENNHICVVFTSSQKFSHQHFHPGLNCFFFKQWLEFMPSNCGLDRGVF